MLLFFCSCDCVKINHAGAGSSTQNTNLFAVNTQLESTEKAEGTRQHHHWPKEGQILFEFEEETT